MFSSAGAATAAAPPFYESVVPFGLVPGELLTPAASAAIAEVESSFQGAARLAAMRAVQRSGGGDVTALLAADDNGGDASGASEGRSNSDVQVSVAKQIN